VRRRFSRTRRFLYLRLRFCALFIATMITDSSREYRLGELRDGARATLALLVGVIPFGIIFGAVASPVDLACWRAGMSLFVFAGSAQFIATGLVAAGSAYY